MALARSLVQGADVWLNTPVRPHGGLGHQRHEGGAQRGAALLGARRLVGRVLRPGDRERPDGPRAQRLGDLLRRVASRTSTRRIEIEANSLFELLETPDRPAVPRAGRATAGPAGWIDRWSRTCARSARSSAPTAWSATTSRSCTCRRRRRAARSTADGFAGRRRARRVPDRGSTSAWHQVHVDTVDADESVADLGAHARGRGRRSRSASSRPTRSRCSSCAATSASPASSSSPTIVDDGRRRRPVDDRPPTLSPGMAPLDDRRAHGGDGAGGAPATPWSTTPIELGRVAWAG